MSKMNTSDLCSTCKREISPQEKAITCSSCFLRYHLPCTQIGIVDNIQELDVDLKTWMCERCTENYLSSKKLNLIDKNGRISTTFNYKLDAMSAALVRLEDEVNRLHTENSRIHSKNGHLWRAHVRLQEEVSELQEIHVNKVLADEHKRKKDSSGFVSILQ